MAGAYRFTSGDIAPPSVRRDFCNLQKGETPLTRPDLYARAPWYAPGAFLEGPLIAVYSDGVYLPNDTPEAALRTDDWARRIAVPGTALWRWYEQQPEGSRRPVAVAQARERFVRLVYQRMRRTPGTEGVAPILGLDTWVYRTGGEVPYGPALSALMPLAGGWDGSIPYPRQAALVLRRPMLRAEFRYLRRKDAVAFM